MPAKSGPVEHATLQHPGNSHLDGFEKHCSGCYGSVISLYPSHSAKVELQSRLHVSELRHHDPHEEGIQNDGHKLHFLQLQGWQGWMCGASASQALNDPKVI